MTEKPRRTPTWLRRLKAMGACEPAVGWALKQGFKTWDECWQKCERADWLLWAAGKLAGPPESDSRKLVVRAAAACAETSLQFIKNDAHRRACRDSLDVVIRWAEGRATLDEVGAARSAAYAAYAADACAASAAAAYAADAADAAAAYAAAAYAAYAADACAYAAYAVAADAYAAAVAADAAYAVAAYAVAADADARSKALREMADLVRTFYPKAPSLKAAFE